MAIHVRDQGLFFDSAAQFLTMRKGLRYLCPRPSVLFAFAGLPLPSKIAQNPPVPLGRVHGRPHSKNRPNRHTGGNTVVRRYYQESRLLFPLMTGATFLLVLVAAVHVCVQDLFFDSAAQILSMSLARYGI